MSIVAIISSPRKGANTDVLVNAVADGAKENGKEVVTFYLNALANKKGCQGCDGCKRNGGSCITKDDLTPILDAIRESEGIIVSSPVYFGEACGQYRLLEDRFYGFLKPDFSPSIEPGKKLVVITTAGSAGADALADKMETPLKNFLGFNTIGKMAVVTKNDRKFAEGNADLIAQAKAIGKKF